MIKGTGQKFVHLVRILLGIGLVWAALVKLDDPVLLLNTVYRYELVGKHLGYVVALALPYVELVVGVCLISSVFAHAASWLAAGLGAVFVAVQVSALARGLVIECGCFGNSGGEVIGPHTVIRASIVLFAGLFVGANLWLREYAATRTPSSTPPETNLARA